MSSLYCNQTAEVSQMFAKSLEEEIRKFERKQSTNTLFVEVCHSRPFESEEETELRIVLCLSSVCEEIVHLFYSICKVHENEIVQFLQRCYTNTTNRRLTRSKKKTLCDKHCNLNWPPKFASAMRSRQIVFSINSNKKSTITTNLLAIWAITYSDVHAAPQIVTFLYFNGLINKKVAEAPILCVLYTPAAKLSVRLNWIHR